ncbi:MAG: DMT family transporter [Chthoniobacteraceae bacterium]
MPDRSPMPATAPPPALQLRGYAFGLLGVLAFSLTLPATRVAVASFDPFFVGLGRELVAACLAAPLLFFTGQPRPTGSQLRRLGIVVLALIVGFPVLSAVAMRHADASHGAVVLGLLPLATAVAGFLRAHERPSFGFWCASAVGSCAVVGFALAQGGGSFRHADWALLGAVVASALGYAEGARLGREMGGWQVISWAVVLGLPITIPAVTWLTWQHGLTATPASWMGFTYVSVVSAFLGFFPWYHGLAIGGVARVGQIQLLQPFFTLAFAALFMGEAFSLRALLAASLVALSILAGRKAKILHGRGRS